MPPRKNGAPIRLRPKTEAAHWGEYVRRMLDGDADVDRQMRDAGKAAVTIMAELELVAPVAIQFLVATLNLEWQ